MTETETETKASWLRLKRSVRRLIVSYGLLIAAKACPGEDVNTLVGIGCALNGQVKDIDEDRAEAGMTSVKEI